MRTQRRLIPSLLLLAACVAPATPDETGGPPVAVSAAAFAQPAGTVAVSFAVDDTANAVYLAGELRWKGAFLVDPATRILTADATWSGTLPGDVVGSGWPTLYDDGPWTAAGHEPIGAVAGDHVWGTTVFVAPPAAGADTYEYGLVDATVDVEWGGGWIWTGPNGSFTVPAGATGAITAQGMAFARFGTTDLVLTLDTRRLDQFPDWTWDLSTLTVKGSAWGWAEVPLVRIGHGTYVFVLSTVVGKGHRFPHYGLLNAGDVPEFVFVICGEEYKVWYTDDGTNWWAEALQGGVRAATFSWSCLRLAPAEVIRVENGNTAVTVPDFRCRPHCGR